MAGTLKLCLDSIDLNKAIIRDPIMLPTVFSIPDLKDVFYNLELNDESSFSTPFGVYRFLRFSFGVSNAPEEIHKISSSVFGCILNVIVYFDDLLITGESEEEYDIALKSVLEQARLMNLKFNPNKVQ
ncbi:hypothetical protein JTB14_030400 [Gonioctena quinquepunctata]|nr:hypothetical protein JTB14_030400 [Gonioctena quinquepunctata]